MKISARILVPAIALVAAMSIFSVLYPTGAPAGYTGSPADNKTCVECHGGSPSAVTDWITTNIPAGGYVPGTTYQVTASNKLAGSGKYGFELSPQAANGTLLGTLTAGTGSKIVSTKYITHSNANSTQKAWTFNWTAPAKGTGAVTFYAAFAQGKPGLVSKTSLVVQEATTTAIDKPAAEVIQMYPNPAHDNVKLVLPLKFNTESTLINIYSLAGQQVVQMNGAALAENGGTLGLASLLPGVYIVMIANSTGSTSTRLVIK